MHRPLTGAASRACCSASPSRSYTLTSASTRVTPADSPAAVTRAVDAVLVCVTSTACVEEAVFGPGGVAEAGATGKLLIDISTTEAEATFN